jgi:iron complex outermembrane receptor protein
MPTRSRLPIPVLATLAIATNLAAQDSAAPTASAEPAPARPAEEVVQLEEIEVRDSRLSEYAFPEKVSIGKGGIPLDENPQPIVVIPRSLLDDIAPMRLEDALRGVSGVQTGGYYNNWDYFRIRGFSADFNTYIDGLRGGNGMGEETLGLEQIEVMKGPAALYGAGPVGGLVNLVSKRPVAERFTTVGATVGSYDYYQASADFNQPLAADESVLFRVNTFYRDQQSNIDQVESHRTYFAPSLTWKINDRTSITFLARYRDLKGVFDMPLPAIGTVLPNPNGTISSDLFVGQIGSNKGAETYEQIGYEFIHEINDSLRFTQNFRFDHFEQTWGNLMYPWAFSAPYDTLQLLPYNYAQDWNDTAVDTRLDAEIEQGSVTHNLTGGFDYFRKDRTNESNFGTSFIPLDVFDPNYSTGVTPALTPLTAGSDFQEIMGFYAQDHLQLPSDFTVTAGGRYDIAETSGGHDTAFTPRIGGTWEFTPGAIAYVSYSEAFAVQSTPTASLKPETGDNREVGLRNHLLDKRLVTTASLFQVTRRDIATANPILGGPPVTAGEQRSRGGGGGPRSTPVTPPPPAGKSSPPTPTPTPRSSTTTPSPSAPAWPACRSTPPTPGANTPSRPERSGASGSASASPTTASRKATAPTRRSSRSRPTRSGRPPSATSAAVSPRSSA